MHSPIYFDGYLYSTLVAHNLDNYILDVRDGEEITGLEGQSVSDERSLTGNGWRMLAMEQRRRSLRAR